MRTRPRRHSSDGDFLRSRLAVRRAGTPDSLDLQRIPLPRNATRDPEALANAVFDVRSSPGVVRALFALRQALVPILGIEPSDRDTFGVREVTDGEALLHASERHLDFWCSIGVDGGDLCATTSVVLKGWRGRLYWIPTGLLHVPVLRAMMRRAMRRLS